MQCGLRFGGVPSGGARSCAALPLRPRVASLRTAEASRGRGRGRAAERVGGWERRYRDRKSPAQNSAAFRRSRSGRGRRAAAKRGKYQWKDIWEKKSSKSRDDRA